MVRTALGAALALCLAAACSQDSDSTSLGDPVEGGGETGNGLVSGGQLHKAPLAASLGATADPALLLAAVERDLVDQTGPLDPEQFVVRTESTSTTASGAALRHVDFQQTVGGVPVHGTHLQLTVRDGSPPMVLSSSFRLYRGADVDTTASVDGDKAAGMARQSLSTAASAEVVDQQLEVRDMDGTLELVWATAVRGSHDRSMVIASGPRAGQVTNVDERVYETTGNVSGFVVTGGAPGALGVVTQAALANLTVSSGAGATASTDAAGNYVLDATDGDTVTANLNGTAASVGTDVGEPLSASGTAAATLDLVLGSEASGEAELAQATAYVFADVERSFAEANGIDPADLGEPLTINTNIADVCNAFFSPFDRSLNFFASGGGCNNSATDSITFHEHGHFIDDAEGGIQDGGLSEGWGDTLSCFILGTPDVGFDLLPGEAIRSCDNDYQFPPGGNDEVHNLGQAWAGFTFLVREGLIAKLGDVDGDALARALVIPSLPSNAADIPTAVREVFLRDDDDGDLSNGTPNSDVLLPAAQAHALDFVVQ
ncbi:MAG TPA: hypothetical protein VKB80_20050 [Kofleriaceae bacterium]|nr:hypothetical protein [Kofleriaceae bacterium]